jgi:hypothetical protein
MIRTQKASGTFSGKFRRIAYSLTATLSLLAGQLPAHAGDARGLDGVELEAVPLDTGSDCSSIVLRGTRSFQGTAFVMPRVLVGITREGEDLFQISPDDDGSYILSLGLYFPDSTTNLDLRSGRSTLFLHGCNFDAALHQMNKDVTDPKLRVNSLARLPVQNIEVVIDGLKNRATIGETGNDGRAGTSILNYEGNDHTVEFKMTAAEIEGIMRRLKRQQGISIRVNMRFTARSNDGALFAEVDLDQLATSLQTTIGGQYMIASGDLKVAVERAVSNMHINIQTEAGSGTAFQKISDQLMTMILSNVTDVVPSTLPAAQANPPTLAHQASNPADDEEDDSTPAKPKVNPLAPIKIPIKLDKAVRHGNAVKLDNSPVGPAAPLAPAAAPVVPSNVVAGDNSGSSLSPVSVKVSAVISYLKSQKKRTINYTNTSELQTAVYTTPVNLQARLQDPDVREIVVRSGELASAMPGEIKKGDHVTIGVAKTIKEKIEYKAKRSYLSANEITRLNLTEVFPEILADDFIVHNEDTKQGYLAVGKRIYKRSYWFSDYTYPQRYFWTREQWGPQYGIDREAAVDPSLEAYKGLALQASFSRVGTRQFQLADLVQDNVYWTAAYDDVGGKIELVAKRDLGYLSITGVAPVVKSKLTVDQIVEETRENKKTTIRSAPQKVRDSVVATERLSYQIFVGRPGLESQSVQVVTPNGIPMSGPAMHSTDDSPPVADVSTDDTAQP